MEGTQIGPGAKGLAVNICYVVDPSLIDDDALSVTRCEYVAIGVADAIDRPFRDRLDLAVSAVKGVLHR